MVRRSLTPVLVTLGVFALLWLFARDVLELSLVLVGVAFALVVAGLFVATLVDLAGPTRTDPDGRVLGFRERMRSRLITVRNLGLARQWRSPRAVLRAAMRRTAKLRVTRPAGPAAAEHIAIWLNPRSAEELDGYQRLEEAVWDIAENYRRLTEGSPAAGPTTTVWLFGDLDLPRGYVRARALLREPAPAGLLAHATVTLTPALLLPRGQGARSLPGVTPIRREAPGGAPGQPAGQLDPAEARTEILARPDRSDSQSRPTSAVAEPDRQPDATDPTIRFPTPGDPGDADTVATDSGQHTTEPHPRSVQLISPDGSPSGPPVALAPGARVQVGRSPDCDILVADSHVSRVHLELRADGARVWVRDAGSRGGTYVEGTRLAAGEEVLVQVGALIELSPVPATKVPVAALRIG